MKPWTRIEPTETHKVGWRTVVTKNFIMPDGNTCSFDTFGPEHQEFVSIIGLTHENKVVIGTQFRCGPEKIMDEIPGGFVEKGESLEDAAKREFLEETGYRAGDISYLGYSNKDTYMNARWHYFLAKGCKKLGRQELDDEEHIVVSEITIAELIENAKSNRMTDAEAVLYAYDELRAMK